MVGRSTLTAATSAFSSPCGFAYVTRQQLMGVNYWWNISRQRNITKYHSEAAERIFHCQLKLWLFPIRTRSWKKTSEKTCVGFCETTPVTKPNQSTNLRIHEQSHNVGSDKQSWRPNGSCFCSRREKKKKNLTESQLLLCVCLEIDKESIPIDLLKKKTKSFTDRAIGNLQWYC